MNEPRRGSVPARGSGEERANRARVRAEARAGGRGGSSSSRRRASGPPAVVPMPAANQVRWSRVLTAQARIAVGYYDRDDVKQRVVDALLHELKKR